ncbi:uncharacterized protein LOC131073967 [Cryptomeria japonica]|uniref:uncharacterized protein LOC131073967 n=1 Tax=Cryptomeria japonica TaxID=3369 RepID=UPI0027D9FA03|nr:uncharacterized protein LOC131073967 [Cryptomeria japonica]XP_057866482.2 uncharacterized protein LOC131073967 [Cryptomeria japonica]
MHSLAQESSGESGQIEEMPESLLQRSDSTNSDEFSNIPHILPRIGDKYQVNVPPFKPPVNCYQPRVAESLNFKGNKDENIEQWLIEGLSLPIMQISSFHPSVSVKECQKTYVNGPTIANEHALQDYLSVVSVKSKTDGVLHQHDFFQLTDEGCVHNLSDTTQLTEHNIDSSIINIKTDIIRAEDSSLTAKNVPDAFDYGIGQRRKRSRVSWKRVKKIKIDFLDPSKQSYGSRCQNPLEMMHNIEDTNSRSYMIVPGRSSAPWSKIEEDLFILGLYIFGKNFNPVKRFVQTKEIKDILSYYYGIFFRTESYCRWAESRKTRSRKCIQGQRIFSGWRQQELLTRLLPHISDSSKDEVPEIMKQFNEGRISMEEFVTKLKGLAGSEVLVQAVGIGKGKQDLTRALIDPAKANQVLSRCKIPVGKACSSLSTEDILKFLTGDFRLSKAQRDDLFWEAVWPRLLARGWHSEQPENQVLFGLRQSLVFLIPGVQKFSRRKLTKGIHYFDSVSEVLRNVASGPMMLELESDLMSESEGKTEILSTSENGEVETGHVEHSHTYLQPRFYTKYSDSCMFTVVDTSLTSQPEKPPRTQRRVTLSLANNSEMFQKVSLETEEESYSASHLTEQFEGCKCCLVGDVLNSKPDKSTTIAINNKNSDEKIKLYGTLEASNPDQNDALSSSWEQSRSKLLSDCKDDTVYGNSTKAGRSKVKGAILILNSKEETYEATSDANSSKRVTTISSSSQKSPERSICISLSAGDSFSAHNISNTLPNSRGCRATSEMGLGLQLLQVQPENTDTNYILQTGSEVLNGSETEENAHYGSSSQCPTGEPAKVSTVLQASSHLTSGPKESKSTEPQENNASALLENAITIRRQSMRVRPLTARASEAFASGFFDTKRRKKSGEKMLNSYPYRTKSLCRLIGDEVTASFNACRSES